MAYTTLADVRTIDGLEDEAAYPDELITDSIARAEELITDYCGPRIPTTITKHLEPDSGRVILTSIPWIRSVSLVELDGTDSTSDVEDFDFYGEIIMAGTFNARRIKVTVVAGEADEAPERLAWAAKVLAAAYTTDENSSTPERALAVQSEFGQIQLAQAGGKPDRPTAYPDINAALNRFRLTKVGT